MSGWNLEIVADWLHQAALDPELWPDALSILSREVGAAGAVLLSTNVHLTETPCSPELEEMRTDYFQNRWSERDERDRGVPTLLQRGVLVDQDFTTQEAMQRSAYYQDFIERHGYRWFAGVGFRSGTDLWCVSIQRRIKQGAFEPNEIERLLALWRPLNDATALSRQLGFSRVLGASDALEMTKQPGILFDDRGRVIIMNSLAERLVGDLIDVVSRKLVFTDPLSQLRFKSLLDYAMMPHPPNVPEPPLSVARARNGEKVKLRAITLREWSRFTFTNARLLLLLDVEKDTATEVSSTLKEKFGLTPAEIGLTLDLLEGISVKQAAEKQGITYDTARSYVKSIYLKTGIHRQSQLVATVLSGRKA